MSELKEKLFIVSFFSLILLSIILGFLLYRGNNTNDTYKINETKNNRLIEYLIKDNTRLKLANRSKQDSLDILILNNIKGNDKKINYINSLSDTAKIRLLSERYNLHY